MNYKHFLIKRKGFTLIEVILVAAIISFLGGITVYACIEAMETARKNACIKNRMTIYQGAALYSLETGQPLTPGGIGSIGSLREKLCGENGYIKDETAFECPSSNDASYDDYSFVWGTDSLLGFGCTVKTSHNVDQYQRTSARRAIREKRILDRQRRREERLAQRRMAMQIR